MAAKVESGPATGRLYPEDLTHADVTRQISHIPLDFPEATRWWLAFGIAGALTLLFAFATFWLLLRGVGTLGLNNPVFWGVLIASYVWWISMAHAGTMISALLLLLHQGWRNSLNRFAEAMTVFAVVQAGLMPILHLGRPSLFYWLLPYPNTMTVWPQFKSPLEWDIFGVTSYLIVSTVFFYVGLIPDFASLRDRAKGRLAQVSYGLLALGWRSSARQWRRWQITYWIAAGLTVALVMMVESTVSLLFAGGLEPGWHTTVYPPFFLLGAIFQGFAVVTLIALGLRWLFGLQPIVTDRHLDLLARMMLTFGHLALLCWILEQFSSWYTGEVFERQILMDRWTGLYAPLFWASAAFSFFALQALWLAPLRRNRLILGAVAALAVAGIWLEHFVAIASTLHHGFLPSSWDVFWPSPLEWSMLLGTIGLFSLLFLLFVRFLPLISMFEVREVLEAEGQRG